MVVVCAVPDCPRKKTTTNISLRSQSIQFHRFPLKKPELLAKWIKSLKLPDFKPTINTYICSAHFKEDDYEIKGTTKLLKADAVPYNTSKHITISGKNKKALMSDSDESDAESKTDDEEYGVIEQLEDDEDESQIIEEDEEEEEIEVPQVKEIKVRASKKDEKSRLSGLLNSKDKDTLHLLIVGDDGEITNSEYLYKKEEDIEISETKPDIHKLQNLVSYGEKTLEDDSNKVSSGKKIESYSRSFQTNLKDKESVQISQNVINRNKEEIKKLEEKLALSRKKVKRLHKRCSRSEKKVKELKVLLKLLVLKRGKGVKNLSQLFEEYAKKTDSGTLSY